MARMNFLITALVAFVYLGFAIPTQAISVIGIWEGECMQKFDSNYDCLPKGLVSTFPYYLNISQAAGGQYDWSVAWDTTIELGRRIANSTNSTWTQGLQGDPNAGPVCTDDSDGLLPAFSVYLQHIGQNDMMILETSEMVDEGPICTTDHSPLFCHITRDDRSYYANQICVLYRKGGTN